MKQLHLPLNLISVLLLVILGCLTATKGYSCITRNALFTDSTLVKRGERKFTLGSSFYRTRDPYLADKEKGITETLRVDVPLATATGFGGYIPLPPSRPDFVFIRFAFFNKPDKNRNN